MIEFLFADQFKRDYQDLTEAEQKAIKRALGKLQKDPSYPSLRTKKMKGKRGVWEARASRDLRIIFSMDGNTYLLRSCGHHDPTLRDG